MDNTKGWDTGTKCDVAKTCSWQDNNAKVIVLTPEVYSATRLLCEKFVDSEWQIMLIGEVKEKDVLITDYYVPKQEVGGAFVHNEDCITKEMIDELGIVGTMHSHCSMGVFFSSTDDESTNMSSGLNYHIVTNNKGEFNAVSKITLPCGMVSFKETKVNILFPHVELKGLENITKVSYTVTKHNYRDYDVPMYCTDYQGNARETVWDKQMERAKRKNKKDKRYI